MPTSHVHVILETHVAERIADLSHLQLYAAHLLVYATFLSTVTGKVVFVLLVSTIVESEKSGK